MGFVAQEEPRSVASPFPFPGTQCIAAGEAVVCTAYLGIEVDQTPWAAVQWLSLMLLLLLLTEPRGLQYKSSRLWTETCSLRDETRRLLVKTCGLWPQHWSITWLTILLWLEALLLLLLLWLLGVLLLLLLCTPWLFCR